MIEEHEDFEYEVNEWRNQRESNVLPRGRYRFDVVDSYPHTAKDTGNKCVVVTLKIEEKDITVYLIRCDSEGKRHKMTYLWNNFLYAIGVRNTNTKFVINNSFMVGKFGWADLNVIKDDRSGEDKNMVSNFSPMDEEIAPVSDVPAESKKPKEEKKEEAESNVEDL